VLVFAAAGVPIYLCIKLDGHLKLLTGLLACFVITHGIYHALDVFGYGDLGEVLFDPLSIAILISFGITYWRIRKKKEIVTST